MEGFISFLLSIATIVAIYSILTLALNVRWGFTGLLDFGIAGFFAIGAYTSAILTSPPSEELVLSKITIEKVGVKATELLVVLLSFAGLFGLLFGGCE